MAYQYGYARPVGPYPYGAFPPPPPSTVIVEERGGLFGGETVTVIEQPAYGMVPAYGMGPPTTVIVDDRSFFGDSVTVVESGGYGPYGAPSTVIIEENRWRW